MLVTAVLVFVSDEDDKEGGGFDFGMRWTFSSSSTELTLQKCSENKMEERNHIIIPSIFQST